mgnify:CR=1 FL=1
MIDKFFVHTHGVKPTALALDETENNITVEDPEIVNTETCGSLV